ncbi:MAG: linear amide C-N hydrolase [Clostridiales bacterium]|nr:linear amide C-N hydrolase [Clostridiales bacterium]
MITKRNLTINQLETLQSFIKLNQETYLCSYRNAYYLDKLLKRGCKSIPELVSFLSGEFSSSKKALAVKPSSFGCTSFNVIAPGNEYLFARNFDFINAPCMVLWTHPQGGFKSIGICDMNAMLYGVKFRNPDNVKDSVKLLTAPYICVDGINEKGLSIAALGLNSKPVFCNTGKKPLISTVAVRAVLDKCASVNEAVDLFKGYDIRDSFGCCFHYQVTDSEGKSVVIEYVENEIRVIDKPVSESASCKTQVLTNFFLSPDGYNINATGYDRYDIVKNDIISNNMIYSDKETMRLLSECAVDYREKFRNIKTLWSAVYNNTQKTLDLCTGMDYSRRYRFDISNPCKYAIVK